MSKSVKRLFASLATGEETTTGEQATPGEDSAAGEEATAVEGGQTVEQADEEQAEQQDEAQTTGEDAQPAADEGSQSMIVMPLSHLWKQLPASCPQPHTSLSDSNTPVPTTGTSSVKLPLFPSITPSLFHSRFKIFLFHKTFPPYPSLFFFRTDATDSPDCLPLLWSISILIFFYFIIFFIFWFHVVDYTDPC